MKTGLLTSNNNSSKFGLESVDLSAQLTGPIYTLQSVLKYINTSNKCWEAKYVFPVGDVSIYHFEAKVEDREVICVCRERSEAEATYDEAVKKGYTAFLSEQDEQCEDIFKVSLGNVPPNAKVEITLKYVGHLAAENVTEDGATHGELRMTIPEVLRPRYSPGSKYDGEFEKFDRLTGVATGHYRITFESTLNMSCPIVSVCSSKDTFTTQFTSEDHHMAKVSLVEPFIPDHDLQLVIKLENKISTAVVLEKGDKEQSNILSMSCLMVELMPDLSQCLDIPKGGEFIFVVDRSGSMAGSRIECAKSALMLCIHCLQPGWYFQIIGFGSTYNELFKSGPKEYTKETANKAIKYLENMEADMSGTEMYEPLEKALASTLTHTGCNKNVIFMTDGDVTNANNIIGLVHDHNQTARLFCIGIGEGTSTHLVSGISKAGRGYPVYLRDEKRLPSEVARIFATAQVPPARNVKVEVNMEQEMEDGTRKRVKVVVVPEGLPPILSDHLFTFYVLFVTEDPDRINGDVTISFDINGKRQMASLDLSSCLQTRGTVDCKDQALLRLAGRERIRERIVEYYALDAKEKADKTKEMEKKRREIVDDACILCLYSPFTAFIGVDPKKQDIKEPIVIESSGSYDMVDGAHGGIHTQRLGKFHSGGFWEDEVDGAHGFYSSDDSDEMSDDLTVAAQSTRYFTKGVPRKPDDKFNELLNIQSYDGSYTLDERLANVIGVKVEEMKDSLPKESAVTEDVWATALALAFIKIAFPMKKHEYFIIEAKAKAWLTTKRSIHVSAVEFPLENAKTFLRKAGVKQVIST